MAEHSYDFPLINQQSVIKSRIHYINARDQIEPPYFTNDLIISRDPIDHLTAQLLYNFYESLIPILEYLDGKFIKFQEENPSYDYSFDSNLYEPYILYLAKFTKFQLKYSADNIAFDDNLSLLDDPSFLDEQKNLINDFFMKIIYNLNEVRENFNSEESS